MEIKEGIVVCNNNIKINIIKNNYNHSYYKFFGIDEISSIIFPKVNPSAITYLVKNGYNYDLARDIIKILPYIENKKYNNKKLDELVNLKLNISPHISKINELDLYMLKNNHITFIDIAKTKENIRVIENVKKINSNIEIIDANNKVNDDIEVYSYSTIELECEDLFNRIINLINNGVKLNNINIINVDDNYVYYLNRMSYNYNIPLSNLNSTNLLCFNEINNVLKQMNTLNTFSECLDQVTDENIKLKLINIIIKYDLIDEKPCECINLFKEILKSENITKYEYLDSVKINQNISYSKDEYVFFVNFNLESTPKTFKDDDYLSDIEKNILGLSISIDYNKYEKDKIIKIINNACNLTISYKEYIGNDKCLPSNLIKELDLKVLTNNVALGNSKIEDTIRLAINYDNLLKYRISDEYLDQYDINYLNYNTFDNKFKGINQEYINGYFNNKRLVLSYTTLKKYMSCPFSYYIDNVLNLSEYEDNIGTKIGLYAHKVLEKSYQDNFCMDDVTKIKDEFTENIKEDFYLSKVVDLLDRLIIYNKTNESNSKLDQRLLETNINLDFKTFLFTGKIDKILYTIIDNTAYVVIIDYKTGNDEFSLENIEDGINLQLPVYSYLVHNCKKFKDLDIKIIGIYLQKINIIAVVKGKDIDKQYNDSFKLKGYSNSNLELIEMLDSNYDNSNYISGMKCSKEGLLYKSVKTIDDQIIDKLDQTIENMIISESNNILNAKFEIEPKKLDKISSCEYCLNKDICYVKYENIINLVKKEFEGDGE